MPAGDLTTKDKIMDRAQAAALLTAHPTAPVTFLDRPGPGFPAVRRRAWLDEGGALVMAHPTDPKAPPIAAPAEVDYFVDDESDQP